MGELRVIKAVKDFGEDYETELVNLVKRKQLEEQDNGPINDDDTDDSIGLQFGGWSGRFQQHLWFRTKPINRNYAERTGYYTVS